MRAIIKEITVLDWMWDSERCAYSKDDYGEDDWLVFQCDILFDGESSVKHWEVNCPANTRGYPRSVGLIWDKDNELDIILHDKNSLNIILTSITEYLKEAYGVWQRAISKMSAHQTKS